jgi:cytoskeletal protein RodZ
VFYRNTGFFAFQPISAGVIKRLFYKGIWLVYIVRVWLVYNLWLFYIVQKRTLAEELHEAPQQQIYKNKSTSVGTKNQVESFLVILDSG